MAISPERPLLNDHTVGSILGPDGVSASRPTLMLTVEEAKLLREYKKFLLRHHLQEATRCLSCFEGNRPDFHRRSFVTDQQILFECSCRLLYFGGPTI